MLLQDVVNHIRFNVLVNITNVKQANQENVLRFIKEGITHIHSTFPIKFEQAIIVVPEHKNVFKLSNDDEYVTLGTLRKLGELSNLTHTRYNQIIEQLLDIKDEYIKAKVDKIQKTNGKSLALDLTEPLIVEKFSDNTGSRFLINELNVYDIGDNTFYFPNCKFGDLIYVTYRPKPKNVGLNEEIDLPDTLLNVLYTFVGMKAYNTLEGYNKEFYPTMLSMYDKAVQEARLNLAVKGNDLNAERLISMKGFF